MNGADMSPSSVFALRHLRVLAAVAVGAWSAAAHAAPLDLDFGELGPSFHDVGAIDAGVNVIRAGNITASGLTVGSSITYSIPVGLQVDQMTVEFLSYSRTSGALLSVRLLAPNEGHPILFGFPALNTEIDFQDLVIADPSEVTTTFEVIPHPSAGGGVNHAYALRIYASEIAADVPEPRSAAMLMAGMIGLIAAWRTKRHA
ncbi:MAG: hypothetical protein JNK67_31970 [Alphaproteobacteria bacterium]|nr:hypothetical protein [Alphaproteobacteria bacterium]